MNEKLTSMLDRAFMFLEDSEWRKADEYCEKALDIDPKNAKAYLGKLMAECKAKNFDSLKNCKKPIDENQNYKKIIAFADKKLADDLVSLNETLKNISDSKKQNRKRLLKTILSICAVTIIVGLIAGLISSVISRKKALDYTKRDVGETVIYGKYDIDDDDQTEELEWIVLKKQKDKIFVISKYAIEQRKYNNSRSDVVWENCTLRKWLNSDFINSAFSDKEKSKIVETLNINPICYANGVIKSGGKDTKDHVFILSKSEATKYFYTLEEHRMKYPLRAYFVDTYTYSSVKKYGWSWLRSPGSNDSSAAYIGDGYAGIVYIGDNGKGVCDETVFVRPALWISIE